jgi:hypothetical protein
MMLVGEKIDIVEIFTALTINAITNRTAAMTASIPVPLLIGGAMGGTSGRQASVPRLPSESQHDKYDDHDKDDGPDADKHA